MAAVSQFYRKHTGITPTRAFWTSARRPYNARRKYALRRPPFHLRPFPSAASAWCSVQRQEKPAVCVFANRTKLLVSRFLASHVAVGDDIAFPVPTGDAVGTEILITKNAGAGPKPLSLPRANRVRQPAQTGQTKSALRFGRGSTMEALASVRFSCRARSCATTSIAYLKLPTEPIIRRCTRSCVFQPTLLPLSCA